MSVHGKGARVKGISWERAVAKFLGTVTTRSVAPGIHEDRGDVVMHNHVLIECKNHARWRVLEWFKIIESKCTDDEVPVLIIKRPGDGSTAAGLVVMRLGDVDLHHL